MTAAVGGRYRDLAQLARVPFVGQGHECVHPHFAGTRHLCVAVDAG